MFGFGKKKKSRESSDPLAAYDGLLEDLESQGAELRRSAATLLAARGELTRSLERYQQQLGQLTERQHDAKKDVRVWKVLAADRVQTEKLSDVTREALAKVDADAELLTHAAQKLREQTDNLRVERASASARLLTSAAVQDALREQASRVTRRVALEAARDEVEKAHALAEIYRDEL